MGCPGPRFWSLNGFRAAQGPQNRGRFCFVRVLTIVGGCRGGGTAIARTASGSVSADDGARNAATRRHALTGGTASGGSSSGGGSSCSENARRRAGRGRHHKPRGLRAARAARVEAAAAAAAAAAAVVAVGTKHQAANVRPPARGSVAVSLLCPPCHRPYRGTNTC